MNTPDRENNCTVSDKKQRKRQRGCCLCLVRLWELLRRLFRRRRKKVNNTTSDTPKDDAAEVPDVGNSTALIQDCSEVEEHPASGIDSKGSDVDDDEAADQAEVPSEVNGTTDILDAVVNPAPSEESHESDDHSDLRGSNVAFHVRFDVNSATDHHATALTVARIVIFLLLYFVLISSWFVPVEIADM